MSPQEEALIARAVPKRRNEFTTVRACVHAEPNSPLAEGVLEAITRPEERSALASLAALAAAAARPAWDPASCSAPRCPYTRRGTR
ncbi:hypothetical protein ACIHBO_35265 [Streptomyces avermitilis]|uniref:hypothetical protein n=1 Tax=Streptomyces avermitilis TaxID=33903 RepID=UPI00351CD3A0